MQISLTILRNLDAILALIRNHDAELVIGPEFSPSASGVHCSPQGP